MYFVYILISLKDGFIYIGYTSNLRIRYVNHQKGKVPTTRYRLPVKLVYYEAYLSKKDATKREYFLKSGRGREYIKKLIVNSIKEVTAR